MNLINLLLNVFILIAPLTACIFLIVRVGPLWKSMETAYRWIVILLVICIVVPELAFIASKAEPWFDLRSPIGSPEMEHFAPPPHVVTEPAAPTLESRTDRPDMAQERESHRELLQGHEVSTP